ncbi:hypothetical protein J4448_00965 [Candidatus Woesearchaeota archaeon]|nr:hypothetical protein [Candidatus Woesearchaeota archaeon]
MVTQTNVKVDDLELFKKRVEILLGESLKETDRMDDSVKIQDSIRRKAGKWQGSKEIKRWRLAR